MLTTIYKASKIKGFRARARGFKSRHPHQLLKIPQSLRLRDFPLFSTVSAVSARKESDSHKSEITRKNQKNANKMLTKMLTAFDAPAAPGS